MSKVRRRGHHPRRRPGVRGPGKRPVLPGGAGARADRAPEPAAVFGPRWPSAWPLDGHGRVRLRRGVPAADLHSGAHALLSRPEHPWHRRPAAAAASRRQLCRLAPGRARAVAAAGTDTRRPDGDHAVPGAGQPGGAGGANFRLKAGDGAAAAPVRPESLAQRPSESAAAGGCAWRAERRAEAGSGAA